MKQLAVCKQIRTTHQSYALTDAEFERYNALRAKLGLPVINQAKAEREIGKKDDETRASLMKAIGDPVA